MDPNSSVPYQGPFMSLRASLYRPVLAIRNPLRLVLAYVLQKLLASRLVGSLRPRRERMMCARRALLVLVSPALLLACELESHASYPTPLASDKSSWCTEAASYVAACVGPQTTLIRDSCTDADAEMLLSTPCEMLLAIADGHSDLKTDSDAEPVMPLMCRWFGLGCPPDTSCLPEMTEDDLAEAIALSEPTSLHDPYDAQYRVNEIARIFREAGDPRGLFATVYRLITNRAVESVDAGDYEYPQWANRLITEFARRYLANLHGHLVAGEVTGQWGKYYDLAQNCRVGRGRTLGVAIAVHLMVDLPYTLHGIGSMPDQREDFVLFGDILLEIFPQLIVDIQADYDTDVYDLLNGFFLGKWVDSMTTEGTSTAFIYQGVRLKAWRDGQNLRIFPKVVVDAEILTAWGIAEKFLAKLDANGVL